MECMLEGVGQAEKRVKSLLSTRHIVRGKSSEFREPQVVQSRIYSSEGGRRK